MGYTPEARSVADAFQGREPQGGFAVGQAALREAYESACSPGEGEVDFVSLGCLHCDIEQIKRAAGYLAGKKIRSGVHFMIWTVYPIKCLADENGYTKTIEETGGHIYTSTCPAEHPLPSSRRS